jgi:hypothetical protein
MQYLGVDRGNQLPLETCNQATAELRYRKNSRPGRKKSTKAFEANRTNGTLHESYAPQDGFSGK